MSGRLVIVSGPSGVGKDTVIDAWSAADPRVKRVVACTTRAARPGEVDGADYHFVSVCDFRRMAEDGAFLEWKQVHSNFYATPLAQVRQLLEDGRVAVLKIDVQGALTVMEKRPDAVAVFILAPSDEELERRIRGRGTEEEPVILARLAAAKDEIAHAPHYHYQVVNDDLDAVVRFLQGLVDG
jgi:guanylate kinase